MGINPVPPIVMEQVAAALESAKAHSTPSSIVDAQEQLDRSRGQPQEDFATVQFGKRACWSHDANMRRSAITALEAALQNGYQPSDTAFWLVVAYMEAGQYSEARQAISTLVRQDPSNEQAAALLELFKARVGREGWRGLLYAAGAVLAVAGAYALYRWWSTSPSHYSIRREAPVRLERPRWSADDARAGGGRAPPTGSSGSSASAPSTFGNRGSGSWRL